MKNLTNTKTEKQSLRWLSGISFSFLEKFVENWILKIILIKKNYPE